MSEDVQVTREHLRYFLGTQSEKTTMRRLILAATMICFAIGGAPAQDSCKAVDGNGKPLSGAAKEVFLKKCKAAACEAKAAANKRLPHYAKEAFIAKCEAGH
jgi:hypothetical protein